ncbi:MAG: hypothetical protein IPN68_17105 [Bacteroidetes bacterium]|nr:hypothetical protein [Bacteroidota bacterium]
MHEIKQSKPDWPNVGFDFAPFIENTNATLRNQFPHEFLSSLATGPADAEKIIAADKKENIDGYIVFQMNCWNQVVQTAAKSGKPVLYVDFQFGGSGGFLVYTSAFLKENAPNVGFVASSRTQDLLAAVSCFDIIGKGGTTAEFVTATRTARLNSTPKPGSLTCKPDNLKALSSRECQEKNKESRILVARDQNAGPAESILGIPVEYVSFAEVNKAWETADKDESEAVVKKWKKGASEISGISDETLQTSAAMYLGMKSVLKTHNANAITMNCLGGFYGGHIHAYPCLGFHELLNDGLVGACEADVRSTATMVTFTNMTGRPGYISDPVIDTSKRQIIYAHCVASNKAFGPEGPVNPFTIMTHSEDRQGASVRSVLPVDYMTTTLEVDSSKKEILFHQAKAVGNDPDDRACRTKICGEPVGDIEKLFGQWSAWGWHRVTFYGDLKDSVFAFADSVGWKVVEEA